MSTPRTVSSAPLAHCRQHDRRHRLSCSPPAAAAPVTSPAVTKPTPPPLTLVATRPRAGLEQTSRRSPAPRRQGVAVHPPLRASGDQSRRRRTASPPTSSTSPSNPTSTRLRRPARSHQVGTPTSPRASRSVRWSPSWCAKGNPKNIMDWDDLPSPASRSITLSPLSSGSAKVEPAGAVRRQERRRQEPTGRA